MTQNACLVVAHPDDEILWFSSVLAVVDKIIFCFNDVPSRPKLSRGRSAVVSKYPFPNLVSLDLNESEVYDSARWPEPRISNYGLAISNRASKTSKLQYHRNYGKLEQLLLEELKEFENVYTHNPWGEYGNEEHVQVFRAVDSCRNLIDFELWCSGYFGSRSHSLMVRETDRFSGQYKSLDTDNILQQKLYSLYAEHSAWTWISDMSSWFSDESMFRVVDISPVHGKPKYLPMNFIDMTPPNPDWRDKSLRQLGRSVSRRIWPRSNGEEL